MQKVQPNLLVCIRGVHLDIRESQVIGIIAAINVLSSFLSFTYSPGWLEAEKENSARIRLGR
jgi:hypothetical protein